MAIANHKLPPASYLPLCIPTFCPFTLDPCAYITQNGARTLWTYTVRSHSNHQHCNPIVNNTRDCHRQRVVSVDPQHIMLGEAREAAAERDCDGPCPHVKEEEATENKKQKCNVNRRGQGRGASGGLTTITIPIQSPWLHGRRS